jgi:hypothetical protein
MAGGPRLTAWEPPALEVLRQPPALFLNNMTQHKKQSLPERWESPEEEQETVIEAELAAILTKWARPTDNPKEATLKLTMNEIITRLRPIYSGEIDPASLFGCLKGQGYSTYNQGDMDLVWLMVEV